MQKNILMHPNLSMQGYLIYQAKFKLYKNESICIYTA